MPSSAEYQDAIVTMRERAEYAKDNVDRAAHHKLDADAYTLALRWLRVGAAMEAGTVNGLSFNGVEWMAWRTGSPTPFIAPDPLTAAERAMGVGNG